MNINIFGKVGTGKTSVICKLNLDKKDTLLVDFKGDLNLVGVSGFDSISVDATNTSRKEVIELVKSEISLKSPNFLIFDDADSHFEIVKELLNFLIDSGIKTNIILGSQKKFISDDKTIEFNYFELTENLKLDNIANQINNYLFPSSSCKIKKRKSKFIFGIFLLVTLFSSYYFTNSYFFHAFSKSNSDIKEYLSKQNVVINKHEFMLSYSNKENVFPLPLRLIFSNKNLEILLENTALLSLISSSKNNNAELVELLTKIRENEKIGFQLGTFLF